MAVLICGSLAFDTIATFPGRFAQQILPEQLHILNVSFMVPTLRREFGGCAGNIAYTLSQLGGTPLVMATLGDDGAHYLQRINSWGASTEYVRVLKDDYTAQVKTKHGLVAHATNEQTTSFHNRRQLIGFRGAARAVVVAVVGRLAALIAAALSILDLIHHGTDHIRTATAEDILRQRDRIPIHFRVETHDHRVDHSREHMRVADGQQGGGVENDMIVHIAQRQ